MELVALACRLKSDCDEIKRPILWTLDSKLYCCMTTVVLRAWPSFPDVAFCEWCPVLSPELNSLIGHVFLVNWLILLLQSTKWILTNKIKLNRPSVDSVLLDTELRGTPEFLEFHLHSKSNFAETKLPFTQQCGHYFSSVAPVQLASAAQTPNWDPDEFLVARVVRKPLNCWDLKFSASWVHIYIESTDNSVHWARSQWLLERE